MNLIRNSRSRTNSNQDLATPRGALTVIFERGKSSAEVKKGRATTVVRTGSKTEHKFKELYAN